MQYASLLEGLMWALFSIMLTAGADEQKPAFWFTDASRVESKTGKTLDRNPVTLALQEYDRALVACNPDPNTSVDLEFEMTFSKRGAAQTTAQSPNAGVASCVERVLQGFTVPEIPKGARATLPGILGTPTSDEQVLGALDRSLIDHVIKRHMVPIRSCYQEGLKRDRALTGKVAIRFTISADGVVRTAAAKPESTTLPDADVQDCIAQRFREMVFPEPKGGGIVKVTYPFIFTPR